MPMQLFEFGKLPANNEVGSSYAYKRQKWEKFIYSTFYFWGSRTFGNVIYIVLAEFSLFNVLAGIRPRLKADYLCGWQNGL